LLLSFFLFFTQQTLTLPHSPLITSFFHPLLIGTLLKEGGG